MSDQSELNAAIPKSFANWLPYIVIILFGCLYLVMAYCNHYFFRTWAWDYGTYNFSFYDYAHFRISPNPLLSPHMILLQDHVSFTLMLLAPFYWLLNWLTGTYTLAIVQIFIILAGGLALYELLYFKTSSKLLSILALLQYFTLYGRWASFYTPFNIAIVASSAIPVFLYFFEKKKFTAAWLVIAFILLEREDMALWLIFIGLFLIIEHSKEKDFRKVSIFIILVSMAYFIFLFTVFIPMMETRYAKYVLFNYSALGKNPSEALFFIIRHPLKCIELLFINHSGNPYNDGIKVEFFYVYMLYGGFLLFTKPKYLLLFIPLILKKMYNDLPVRWSIESFYSIEFVSMLPIAVFLIISQIKAKIIRNIIISIVCINSVGITIYKLLEKGRHMNFDNTNFTFFRKSMYSSPYPVSSIHKYLEMIPPDAPVSSSGTINPHLAFRPIDYYFPRVDDATYIAVFNGKDTWPMTQEEFKANINIYLDSPDWEKIVDDSDILILRKKTN
jgi:uncharacterized membrane protein